MIGASEDTVSVDLSVAFFAAVLAMVAFVEFAVTRAPDTPPAETLNQPRPSVSVTPPGWRAVPPRGQFALYSGGRFSHLDLTDMAQAAVDPRHDAVNEDANYTRLVSGRAASPRAMSLTIVLSPASLPEVWSRFTVFPDSDPPPACPDGLNPDRPLFVYVPSNDADIGPLLRYLANCGLAAELRPIAPPSTDGRTEVRLDFNAGSFAIEALFR